MKESAHTYHPARNPGDITERKRADEASRKTIRVLKTLSECNQALVRTEDETELIQTVCQTIVEVGGYPLAWIGYTGNGEEKRIRTAAQWGYDEGYTGEAKIVRCETEHELGFIETAIRTGRPSIVGHILTDPLYKPWRAEALKRGYASCIALPLCVKGGAIGALSIYAADPDAFDQEEIKFLTELASDLSYGIATLRANVQHKRTEEALHGAEDMFRNLVERSLVGVYVIQDGKFRYVNPRLAECFGYSQEEMMSSKSINDLVVPEDRPLVTENIRKRLEGRIHSVHYTFRGLRKDGRQIDVEVFGSKTEYNGKPAVIGTLLEITERKRSEEKLQESEQRFRSLFQDALTANFISTPEGKILTCNPAFIRLFGFGSMEDALQCNVVELYPSPEKQRELLRLLRDKKRLEHHEIELRRHDGTPAYVVENLVGTFDSQGELVEIKGYIFDQTERRQLEQQLIQAQKMESLGALAGGIAHDFNNILGIMLGHLSLVEMYRSDKDKTSESIEVLRKTVQRGTMLVRQLLTFARKSEVNYRGTSVDLLIQELMKILTATFSKTITFTAEVEDNMPLILGDYNQLYQALLNMAVNARDAMPQGGTLSVSAKAISGADARARCREAQAEKYVSITLKDTGMGMNEATKRRIFEPFFTTKEIGKGTGLGLAVVYGVVKSHNGFVEVDSAPGMGSAFTLCFPVAVQTIETIPVDDVEIAEVPGGKETILVVEDEEMLRDSVNALLESKGYRVLEAADGESAIHEYRQHKDEIALVLSDVGLPRRSGWKVLQKMREINPAVKAIIASGYIDPTAKCEMLKAGAREFVQKPYVPSEVLKKIRSVLDETA